jgi:hypothetical protein
MTQSRKYARHLEITNLPRFRDAFHFSESNLDWERGLVRQLMYLMLGDYGEANRLVLYDDFVTHSFGFSMIKDGRTLMDGAIILHGYEQTLSVDLGGDSRPHYSIHT